MSTSFGAGLCVGVFAVMAANAWIDGHLFLALLALADCALWVGVEGMESRKRR